MIKKEIIKELIITYQKSVPRELFPRRVKLPLDSRKIIVAQGVRRSGKSSAMHLAVASLIRSGVSIEQILFVNFDDERLKFSVDEFELIIEAYRELYPNIPFADVYIFFDEIQSNQGWELFIRRIYDSGTHRIYLSGSNSKLLSSEIATSLRGRTLQYEIFPLSFMEYCQFKILSTHVYDVANKAILTRAFHDYLKDGGFPEIALLDSEYSIPILQEYYNVMLFRDLLERYSISNIPAIKYFIRRILANISKATSINKIYNEMKSVGISVGKNTLYEWIDHLTAIYMFCSLSRFDKSYVRENAADKKYYCIDTGLRNALFVSSGNDIGITLENSVYLWLRNQLKADEEINYHRQKYECDFLIAKRDKVIALWQVSMNIDGDETRTREVRGLLEASKLYDCDRIGIITLDTEMMIEEDGKKILVVPAWKIMLQESKK